jgi:N-carbamoyl-L-amino-acid hydrolase
VFSGAYDLAWAHARPCDDGPTQGEELKRIGYLGETPCGGREIDAYFELHIEQGPRLHGERVPVGVVTGGFSVNGWRIGIAGETAHAGPWPMEKRRNALVGAARLAVAIDDIGHAFAKERAKGTAARIVATPNKAGILSDQAEFTGDIRHPTGAGADAMAAGFEAAIGDCARAANVGMTVLDRWVWRDIVFDPELIAMVRASAASRGFATLDLQSEAGHDAYFMRRVCPTTMIFTPCRDGITHNNAEFTTKEEQAPGLQVLADCVIARADRP